MTKRALYVEWQLLADRLHECSMTVGRSKSTELAQMVLKTPILACMVQLGGLLGHLDTSDLLLIRYQVRVGRALKELASSLWVKQAEVRGIGRAGRASTRTRSKRNLSGKR